MCMIFQICINAKYLRLFCDEYFIYEMKDNYSNMKDESENELFSGWNNGAT